MRIPPICEPASRRQTQFISPPKFHSHLLEWNGFQRWPHRAPQPARGCFPIWQYRSPPHPKARRGCGGRRQSAVRGAGRQPSPASEPTLNFKRLIRKRRPFPSLRAAKCDGAGISWGLCGGSNEVTVTTPACGPEAAKACEYTCVHSLGTQSHLYPCDPRGPALTLENLAFGYDADHGSPATCPAPSEGRRDQART